MTTPGKDTPRALLEAFLRCPAEPARAELERALQTYQTEWIRAHAGADAPATTDPARAGLPKPKHRMDAADRSVLERMAEGWVPTTADVPRWAWFESRELVDVAPNPAGSGPDVLRLTPDGWHAIGRTPA